MPASFWATQPFCTRSRLGSGLRTPLSKTMALYLAPSKTPRQGTDSTVAKSFEVDNLNHERNGSTPVFDYL
jgi:hypothetical protein